MNKEPRWVDADPMGLLGWDALPDEHPTEPEDWWARTWPTYRDNRGRLAGWRLSVETVDGYLEAEVPGVDSGRDAPLVASDAPPRLVDLLNRAWKDGSRMGRPPGLTTIVDDAELMDPIREMRKQGRRVTQGTVVAWAGTFTLSELRGYLRVTGRTWQEFLDSF